MKTLYLHFSTLTFVIALIYGCGTATDQPDTVKKELINDESESAESTDSSSTPKVSSSIIGEWIVTEIEMNSAEYIAALKKSNHSPNVKANADELVNQTLKSLNDKSIGAIFKFKPDGALTITVNKETSNGKYEMDELSNSVLLNIEYFKRKDSDTQKLAIEQLNNSKLSLSFSKPIPLEDGTFNYVMLKQTWHFDNTNLNSDITSNNQPSSNEEKSELAN